jgi:hypothetical protein
MSSFRPFSWRDEHAMQVLYLGEVPIGRVAPVGNGYAYPRWLFHLSGPTPGTAAFWHVATTEQKAKADLLAAANDWLNRAGWA